MIVIAEPYVRYTDTLAEAALKHAVANLLQFAEGVCRDHFAQRYEQLEITVVVRIEIGSTRTWTTIKAVTAALVLYGSLRQSVDYLVKDGEYLGRLIPPGIANSIGLQSSQPARQERRLGTPGELRRLFAQVERGEMSAEEATSRALRLLQAPENTDTAHDIPNLTQRLEEEFGQASRRKTMLSVDRGQYSEGLILDKKKVYPRQRPDLALPPTTPTRRRRGVIASRDPRTGRVEIRGY